MKLLQNAQYQELGDDNLAAKTMQQSWFWWALAFLTPIKLLLINLSEDFSHSEKKIHNQKNKTQYIEFYDHDQYYVVVKISYLFCVS